MLNFTAVDFETANRHRSSACAIGVVKVEDGRIVDRFETLIRPPDTHYRFERMNISVHGIHPEDVKGAPTWGDIFGRVMDLIGDGFMVAHNASFDSSVFRYACDEYGIAWPNFHSACTLQISRKVLDLQSYRLPDVVAALGVDGFQHHRALADAEAAARVMVALARQLRAESVEEVLSTANVSSRPLARVRA